VHGEGEKILGMSGLVFGMFLIAAGFLVYWATASLRRESWKPMPLKDEREAA
jgi:hypothetical protein